MSEISTADPFGQESKKMPTGINVLTILTFIGCAYELYSNASSFLQGRKGIEKLQEAQASMENAPDWAKNFAGPEMLAVAEKAFENRIPLLIIGLVGIGLCLFGAIEMRKLKKQGYVLWLVGEILPIVGMIIFIGSSFFNTFLKWWLVIPVLFIILYTIQRKHLKY